MKHNDVKVQQINKSLIKVRKYHMDVKSIKRCKQWYIKIRVEGGNSWQKGQLIAEKRLCC